MDGSAAQVHELHRKFEALNEDVAAALKQQHEALAGVAAASGSKAGERAKRDALRLATRAADWKEDVAALARHIDSQLQHSRALREHHASTQLLSPAAAASADRQLADDESARLRRLRSDLRLLQGFRVGRGNGGGGRAAERGGGQSTGADSTAADPIADDTVRLRPASLALRVVSRSRGWRGGAEAAPGVPRVERQAREGDGDGHCCAAGSRAVRAPARAHEPDRRGRAARQARARRRHRVRRPVATRE
jgi:hypothetical protein